MMDDKYKSLLEYKKSTKDWHYNPSLNSVDSHYVGRFVGNFDGLDEVDFGKVQSCVDLYEGDENNTNSISWGKKDHIRHGYTKDNLPSFCYKIAEMTGLKDYSIALFKQKPGHTNPWHFDTYYTVQKKYGVKKDELHKIKRYLVFLEDWDWGHFLQVGNNVLSNWIKGDTYTWGYGMYHLSSNAGIKDKLTMQITGLVTDDSLHLSNEYRFNLK